MDIRKNDCGCFFLLLELPLQGALSVNALYPQGDALGYGELPLWGALSADKSLYESLQISAEPKKKVKNQSGLCPNS